MDRRSFLAASFAALAAARGAAGQSRGRGGAASRPSEEPEFLTDVPPSKGNVLLHRPTDSSVTVTVLRSEATSVRVTYAPAGTKSPWTSTPAVAVKPDEPTTLELSGLRADTLYEYAVSDDNSAGVLFPAGRFRTARRPGQSGTFVFTLQADSHLDAGCRQDVYAACIANQAADRPDFAIDLGDTFMTGKHPSRASALLQYKAQRHLLSPLGMNAPLLMVLGNHDGEETKRNGADAPGGLATWSNGVRKRYFPNPEPGVGGRFYTANATPHPSAGLLQNYYAFTWGDAQFVMLDPYWTSGASRGSGAGWNLSLGRAQYDWLATTLRGSKARHKFVFIHQLLGGLDDSGRGGTEAAPLYEWGGKEPTDPTTRPADGKLVDAFARRRPGWEKPIHALLVETGVGAVFHGHDHFYARQQLDGITYQLLPQPGHRNYRNLPAPEYGYRDGEFLPPSGHLRVTVSPDEAKVEYVRAATPDLERRGVKNGSVSAAYTLKSRH